jgi:hypothetical protein
MMPLKALGTSLCPVRDRVVNCTTALTYFLNNLMLGCEFSCFCVCVPFALEVSHGWMHLRLLLLRPNGSSDSSGIASLKELLSSLPFVAFGSLPVDCRRSIRQIRLVSSISP